MFIIRKIITFLWVSFHLKLENWHFVLCVFSQAFEHLVELELVRAVDSAASKVQREYQLMKLMLEHGQVMEALQKYPQCPTDVKQWALSAFAWALQEEKSKLILYSHYSINLYKIVYSYFCNKMFKNCFVMFQHKSIKHLNCKFHLQKKYFLVLAVFLLLKNSTAV